MHLRHAFYTSELLLCFIQNGYLDSLLFLILGQYQHCKVDNSLSKVLILYQSAIKNIENQSIFAMIIGYVGMLCSQFSTSNKLVLYNQKTRMH